METPKRSIVKTVVWRVIATIITLVVSFVFTGELHQATNIAIVVALILAAGYYVNERTWDRIEWGRKTIVTRSEKPPRAPRRVR